MTFPFFNRTHTTGIKCLQVEVLKGAGEEEKQIISDLSWEEFPKWYGQHRIYSAVLNDELIPVESPGVLACLLYMFKKRIMVRMVLNYILFLPNIAFSSSSCCSACVEIILLLPAVDHATTLGRWQV